MSINNRPKLNRLINQSSNLPEVHGDYYRPADRIIDILHAEGFTGDAITQLLTTPSILYGLVVTLNIDTTKLDITSGIALGFDSQTSQIEEHNYDGTVLSGVDPVTSNTYPLSSSEGFEPIPRFINVSSNLTAVATTNAPNSTTSYVKLRFKDVNLFTRNPPTDPAGSRYSFLTRDSYELVIDDVLPSSGTDVLLATFSKNSTGVITLNSGTGTRDVTTAIRLHSGLLTVPVTAGSSITAGTVVYISGDDATNLRPVVSPISAVNQVPAGYARTAISNGAVGEIVTGGRLTTSLDASAASVGDPVYADATGSLTLTFTRFKVGVVLTNTTNARVYFNFTQVDLQLPSGNLLLPGGNNLTLNNGSLSGTQTYTLQNRSMTIAATDEYVTAGVAISAGDVVTITSDDATNAIPTVSKITSPTQTPFGIATVAIASGAQGSVTKYGRVTSTLNTTTSVIGAPVFSTGTGGLTLTYGKHRVGTVESLAASGIVFFDFSREIGDLRSVNITASAAISADTVVRITGDDSTNLRPRAATVTAISQLPLGYATTAIALNAGGNVVTFGRVVTTLNASASAVGDPVYITAAGVLSISNSDAFKIGTVVTNTTNAVVFFDFANASIQTSSVPSGTVIASARSTAPAGYLLCNGAAYSRATYATLFAAISTTYGVGDGTTTFNIPDTQGAFLRSAGTSIGYTQNVTVTLGTKIDDAFQGHYHNLNNGNSIWQNSSIITLPTGASYFGNTVNISVGAPISDGPNGTPRIANETRVKSVAVNYFIKY